MYTIKNSERKNFIEAYDENNALVGEAIISPFMESDIHDKQRLNIYIDIDVKDIKDKKVIKDLMFDELLKRARNIKRENEDLDVKFYHCCFSDNKENIEYYSSKEGFKHDEGMYIIRKEINEEKFNISIIDDIEFVNLDFEDKTDMQQLVEEQNKVFNGGYSIDGLKEIKDKTEWVSIAAKHKGKIVGNVVVIVKNGEENIKYGWIDDLFVSKAVRKKGIGENLLKLTFAKLKELHVNESRLEVWSSNKRALSVYNKLGYKFLKETESSIGMFL
ncbi:GNAT family N-acetyltransferase [Sedimentibacter sp. zth1]|uniref:GNAT family N-acetyltransferase n=1 Tax=Sedimentibacter sp. zth1 TaxID=2816908 RepID=UPI001A928378|nr:GNAT family N-acetyltransferase [Sedimentibacter sp. zth1]QSX05107.1 GNAT family N-acetyltransferase [Sedimentibacter sp. zth1]